MHSLFDDEATLRKLPEVRKQEENSFMMERERVSEKRGTISQPGLLTPHFMDLDGY